MCCSLYRVHTRHTGPLPVLRFPKLCPHRPPWALWAFLALVGPSGPMWAHWALVGRALVGPPRLLWAGPLWAPLGPPWWAGPMWAPRVPCNCRPRPRRPPWAVVGRALVGPPGPSWAGPQWALLGYIYIYIYPGTPGHPGLPQDTLRSMEISGYYHS